MEEIAVAAGVTRQTVYAHYPTRSLLLQAILDRLTGEVAATLGATDFVTGPALSALARWLKITWGLVERYPVLLNAGLNSGPAPDDPERHMPVTEQLLQLILRGQRTGEFDPTPAASWLVAATIGLGHVAGQQVSAGQMTSREAGIAFRDSVIRLCAARLPPT